jgi:hypothetical protein
MCWSQCCWQGLCCSAQALPGLLVIVVCGLAAGQWLLQGRGLLPWVAAAMCCVDLLQCHGLLQGQEPRGTGLQHVCCCKHGLVVLLLVTAIASTYVYLTQFPEAFVGLNGTMLHVSKQVHLCLSSVTAGPGGA